MIRRILEMIFIGVISFLFIWGIGAYISLTMNILEWNEPGRVVHVLCWFFIWFVGVMLYHGPNSTNK